MGIGPLKAARAGYAGGKKRIKSYVPPPCRRKEGGQEGEPITTEDNGVSKHQAWTLVCASASAGKQEGSSTAMSLAGYTGAESSESEEGEGMDLAALN